MLRAEAQFVGPAQGGEGADSGAMTPRGGLCLTATENAHHGSAMPSEAAGGGQLRISRWELRIKASLDLLSLCFSLLSPARRQADSSNAIGPPQPRLVVVCHRSRPPLGNLCTGFYRVDSPWFGGGKPDGSNFHRVELRPALNSLGGININAVQLPSHPSQRAGGAVF